MKGLMVTLLILSCTGMVLAQQDNNNGSSTRSGSGEPPVVPIVSSEGSVAQRQRGAEGSAGGAFSDRERARGAFNPTRARGSFDPNRTGNSANSARTRSTTSSGGTPLRFGTTGMGGETLSAGGAAPARRTGSATNPVNLGLPNSAIADLQKFGSVEAPIENPWLGQLTISALSAPRDAPSKSIEAEVRGDTLVFRLTENDLAHINEVAFKYDVPQYLQGKVKKATIEYPPALLAARNTQTAPVGSRFESDDSRWRLASDTNSQTPFQANSWQENNQRRDLNDVNRQAELDRLARLERQRELDRIELQREQDQRLAYAQGLRESEARGRLQGLGQSPLSTNLQDELERLRLAEQLRIAQQNALARTQQGFYPAGRLADNSLLVGQQQLPTARPVPQQPVVQSVVQPVSTYETLVQNQKMQYMEKRLAQLDTTIQSVNADNESLRRELFNNIPRQNNSLVDHQVDRSSQWDRTDATKPDYPSRPVISTGGLANNEQRNGGDRGFDGNRGFDRDSEKDRSNAGATSAKDQGWKLLMFIMLLCSVGLNLYLWAIARGSYMRYEELAHELRETFTVTA